MGEDPDAWMKVGADNNSLNYFITLFFSVQNISRNFHENNLNFTLKQSCLKLYILQYLIWKPDINQHLPDHFFFKNRHDKCSDF